jgi:hypothetical protein
MSSDLARPALIHPNAWQDPLPRVEWGHWVADCGNPHCHDAWRLHEYGQGWICPSCHCANFPAWPDMATCQRVMALLAYRPDPANRNWRPDLGETVEWLLQENLAHGIDHCTTPELGAAASLLVLDVPESGPPTLRVLDEPLVIDAAPRQELEGQWPGRRP